MANKLLELQPRPKNSANPFKSKNVGYAKNEESQTGLLWLAIRRLAFAPWPAKIFQWPDDGNPVVAES